MHPKLLTPDEFLRPISSAMRTRFLTARAAIEQEIVQETLPKRAAAFDDVGNVAAFVASDHARTLTSTTVNISAGATVD